MLLRRLLWVLIALGATCGVVFWILTIPQTVTPDTLPARSANLANGKTMFDAGGCSGCHADENADRLRLAGGRALKSPFGTFYVPNISPHTTDGIGQWTEAQFATAMLKGTSPSGRHYYPAFPYSSYQKMRVDDVRDMFAYIKTLQPVQGRVRPHDLPLPFNIRRGVGFWKLLYLDGAPFQPDSSKSAGWNRGAYLVNALAHCAECHSPRNAMGGIIASKRFAGGPNPTGEGGVPNITQFKLGKWSEQDFANLLETGDLPSFDQVSGEMALVIKSTSQLSAEDRAAMATYLKSLAPVDGAR